MDGVRLPFQTPSYSFLSASQQCFNNPTISAVFIPCSLTLPLSYPSLRVSHMSNTLHNINCFCALPGGLVSLLGTFPQPAFFFFPPCQKSCPLFFTPVTLPPFLLGLVFFFFRQSIVSTISHVNECRVVPSFSAFVGESAYHILSV